ncbi:MAG: tRNA preQ1(34) S-adenosylmethionine ribosyltransferase-isomerase QueA [Candidatus Sumerlaeia bacterium]|nr:tRNA preQ1(34) S-adenosylmethionine ribosyltransferase-isomerase QueA [Candidatus Sumerlaeia bacterium]
MNVDDFYYDLPDDLIATDPAPKREQSRLMVLPSDPGSTPLHRHFSQLPDFLQSGDLLVVNDSRVIPARLTGRRSSGGAVEVLLLHREEDSPTTWSALVRPGKKIREGEIVTLGADGSLRAEVGERLGEGARRVRFLCPPESFRSLLEAHGQLPLPPYIVKKRISEGGAEASYKPEDRERYQTVYAREEGSVAAPTAGLHFSPELLDQLREMGIHTARVTLHVGAGTFQTMEPGGEVANHRMHFEEYEVPEETVAAINAARSEGRRVIAVGTTSVRTLEAVAQTSDNLASGKGTTDLLISPGYQFRVIDGLITNFHLPRSTLLLLVSAMVGHDRLLAAYQEAIRQRYRFFSYGDAMFLTTAPTAKHPSMPKL